MNRVMAFDKFKKFFAGCGTISLDEKNVLIFYTDIDMQAVAVDTASRFIAGNSLPLTVKAVPSPSKSVLIIQYKENGNSSIPV